MKTAQEVLALVAAIVFLIACVSFNLWYEYKFKPEWYAKEVIRQQQQEKSK